MYPPRRRYARYAPRPGYKLASLNYRLGLPIPRGRPIFVGANYEYRQRPRARTRIRLESGTLHYLAARRFTAARCRQLGMQRLQPGVWYDNLADVLYAQCCATDDWGL